MDLMNCRVSAVKWGFIHEIGVVLNFLSLNPLFIYISACKSTTFFGFKQENWKTFLQKADWFL